MIVRPAQFGNPRFLTAVIIAISALGIAAWSLSAHTTQGPARERVIEKAFTRNEVVEFTEIKVSQKVVEPGKAFDANDEWLNTILLKVKNISNKPIVYLSISVDFPETAATGSVMSYQVVFGQKPGSRFPQKHDPIFMMSSDTLEVPLARDYAKSKSFIEHRHRIADIHKAELGIGFVVFADRTGWSAGNFYRQDPNNPDHYINVGENAPKCRRECPKMSARMPQNRED